MCPVDPRCSSTPQRLAPVSNMVAGNPAEASLAILAAVLTSPISLIGRIGPSESITTTVTATIERFTARYQMSQSKIGRRIDQDKLHEIADETCELPTGNRKLDP
jgi:hypothetical protein